MTDGFTHDDVLFQLVELGTASEETKTGKPVAENPDGIGFPARW
jgi:hypothetical protein